MGKELQALQAELSVFCVTGDQRKLLSLKTPNQFIKSKPGPGGMTLDYVEVGYMRRMLVKYCDAGHLIWSVAVERISDFAMIEATKEVVVRVILSLSDKDGNIVVREFFGSKDVAYLRYKSGAKPAGGFVSLGNDFKSAEADGFKKCISSFGIAQDVYEPSVQAEVNKNAAKREAANEGEPVDFDSSKPNVVDDGTTINNKQVAALLNCIKNAKLFMSDVELFALQNFNVKEFKKLSPDQFEKTIAYVTKMSKA